MSIQHTARILGSALLCLGATTARSEAILTALPVQVPAWVENYNPFNVATRLPSVLDFIYEPLVIFNAMQGGAATYRLATAHSYSDDLKTLTFTLRDGVTWSDGQPFTAKDVTFTFNMVLANPALDFRAIKDIIDTVEAPDERTVVFHLKRPNSLAADDIVRVPIVAQHIWSKVENPVTFTNTAPVGTGPLTEIRRFTEQEYIQCRNPNYWDAQTLRVDCMRFPQIANNDQAMAAAARGDLDWMGSFIPDIENTYVSKGPEHHKYWLPPGSYVFFNLNLDASDEGNKAAFNDVNFRRAVSMSFDREAMVDIAGYGYPTVNSYPSGLGRAYHSWNNPEADAQFGKFMQYDVEEAKALLAEAGYRDANGDGFVDTPGGKPVKFDIIVPNGWTDWVNSVQIAVEGLNAIGIDASISTPESAVWTEQLINGSYQAAINASTVGTTPYSHFDNVLHSRNNHGSSRFGAGRYDNPKIDDLLEAFYRTTDPQQQKQIINDIQMIAGAEMPVIPVFNNPMWFQYNTSRFTGFWNADNPVGNPVVHDTNAPERLLHLLSLRPVEN